MRLRTTIFATTAAAALAFGFSPQLLAQGANTQPGASTSSSQGASGGQARSGNAAAPSTSGQATTGQANSGRVQSNGGRADVGLKSEKTETSARIGSSGSTTTIRERSGTRMGVYSGGRERVGVYSGSRERVGVYSGGREDVIVHRRRPHGVIVYNNEPSSRLIVRQHRPRSFVMYNEPRRRVFINERHPGFAINERTMTRSRTGGEINVRAGERSREVTTGSASRIGPNQGSGASRQMTGSQSSGSPAGGEARGPGGNAGKQPSTTGQANH